MSNSTAYSSYRFVITDVRNPNDAGADSFQFADIRFFAAAAAAFFEADFDKDGDVDGDDFLAWQGGFGTLAGAEQAEGDANGDGDVDGDDFLVWQAQFGLESPGGAAAASIPEPVTAQLLLGALVGVVGRRRRGGRGGGML